MAIGSSINSINVLLQLLNTDKTTTHPIKNKQPDKMVVFPKDQPINRLPRAKAEDVGLTTEYVQSFINETMNDPTIRANRIVVVKDGKVIGERYEYPYTPDSWDCVYSATKTVSALALGALWDEGKVDLDEPVCKTLGIEKKVGNAQNKKITLRNLLKMETGNAFAEIECDGSLKWVRDYFNSPSKFKVGTKFEYNSLNTYVIGAVLQKISGKTLAEYTKEKFFDPMGINATFFETSPEGITKSGWGLYIIPEDMAKLGVMVLNDGVWEGKRLLSHEWLDQMTHKQIAATKAGFRFDYGYQMWCDDDLNLCFFNGMYDQDVHIWRNSGVVVVMCCSHNHAFHDSNIYNIGIKYFSKKEPGDYPFVEQKFSRVIEDKASFHYILDNICNRDYMAKDKIANSCGILPLLLQSVMSTYVKGMKGIRFTKDTEDDYSIYFIERGKETRIRFNFKDGIRDSYDLEGNLYDCIADGRFSLDAQSNPILFIRLFFLEYASTRYITIHFGKADDKLKIEFDENPGIGFLESFLESMDANTRKLLESVTKIFDKNYIPNKMKDMFNPTVNLLYKPHEEKK